LSSRIVGYLEGLPKHKSDAANAQETNIRSGAQLLGPLADSNIRVYHDTNLASAQWTADLLKNLPSQPATLLASLEAFENVRMCSFEHIWTFG